MVGSGLAVVQATEASRNTTLARQMGPEAQASRAPFHCSQSISPRPRQRGNSIQPLRQCLWCTQCVTVSMQGAGARQTQLPFQAPTEREEAADAQRSSNYKYDKAPKRDGRDGVRETNRDVYWIERQDMRS